MTAELSTPMKGNKRMNDVYHTLMGMAYGLFTAALLIGTHVLYELHRQKGEPKAPRDGESLYRTVLVRQWRTSKNDNTRYNWRG